MSPERFLAAIVDSSTNAIVATDLEGMIVSWNRGAERLYGYAPEEVVGRSVFLLVPPDWTDAFAALLAEARLGRAADDHETVRRTKDGRLIEVGLAVSPIADTDGRVIGVATVARDITAVKATELALRTGEELWQTVFDCAIDGVIVIDSHGAIEAFNPAAEKLFGYAQSELLGQNVDVLMPSPFREEHNGYIKRYLTTNEKHIIGIGREVRGRRKDGSIFPVHLAVGEMRIGGERKFTGLLHDLTRRVQVEEQLRHRTAMARLGEMAAVIAHEVKNPLAGIRGAIQVIGGRIADSRDAAVTREILGRIDALNDLINDLLLFARPPQPRATTIDVRQVIQSTVDLLARDPGQHGITVEIDGHAPPLQADPELLKIVFVNLFVNAAHAMNGHGCIHVSLMPLDEVCEITVRDEGPGIAEEIRANVFTPFFTTKSRGSGLGLPTARQLVEAHQGTIDIECPEGGGTLIRIVLPYVVPPPAFRSAERQP
jgi:two-component system sensor kinase FixL